MFSELLKEGGLSFERLRSFCLVAQAGGVTKAAKGEASKQTLYSRQIKELEEFFGVELMRRKGRGVVLTGAGERLNVLTRECFASLLDFKSESNRLPVEIVIGAGESLIRWALMPRLPGLQKKLPNVRLKFLNLPTAEVVKRLADGLIDFGVLRRNAVRGQLRTAALGTMGYSLFLHGSLGGEKGNREDTRKLLNGIPLATLEGDGSFRQELRAVSNKHGFELNIQVECSSFPLVASALEGGTVAAILPSIACVELSQRGIREFGAPQLKGLSRDICLAWNPRLVRIRPALEKAGRVFAEVFRI